MVSDRTNVTPVVKLPERADNHKWNGQNNLVHRRSATPLAPPPLSRAPSRSRSPVIRISVNRAGQRLDLDSLRMQSTWKDEYRPVYIQTRVMHLCNAHYLLNVQCSHTCRYEHKHNITPFEREILRFIARETPCDKGPACREPSCVWGHHCVQPEDACSFMPNCKFDVHLTDTRPFE